MESYSSMQGIDVDSLLYTEHYSRDSFKPLKCALAIAIIFGVGGLIAGLVGLGGYFGAFNTLSQTETIIMMAAGGGGGVILIAIGSCGLVRNRSPRVIHGYRWNDQ